MRPVPRVRGPGGRRRVGAGVSGIGIRGGPGRVHAGRGGRDPRHRRLGTQSGGRSEFDDARGFGDPDAGARPGSGAREVRQHAVGGARGPRDPVGARRPDRHAVPVPHLGSGPAAPDGRAPLGQDRGAARGAEDLHARRTAAARGGTPRPARPRAHARAGGARGAARLLRRRDRRGDRARLRGPRWSLHDGGPPVGRTEPGAPDDGLLPRLYACDGRASRARRDPASDHAGVRAAGPARPRVEYARLLRRRRAYAAVGVRGSRRGPTHRIVGRRRGAA